MGSKSNILDRAIGDTFAAFDHEIEEYEPRLTVTESGYVSYVSESVAHVKGLASAKSEELLRFEGNLYGIAFNLDPRRIGVVLLDESTGIDVGSRVERTGRVVDVPVGDEVIGRVIDGLGRPLDGKGDIRSGDRRPIESPAPTVMDRDPVEVPLQTGLKVVDALIPIGRGQRELIVGDRQTGKTAIAIDTVINQHDKNVICIYCAIGKKTSDVAKIIADLKQHDAMEYSIVMTTSAEDPPGLQYVSPYAAMSIAEHFMHDGRDALVILDDLTQHARAYRELSLLLRRPPAREAYPGDIFYVHSRLLERSTHLDEQHGGGSITALPIVETQEENISAYIPTNLISITDGQIYVSPKLYRKGVLPAIDVGDSVSRVGGKTQLPAYRGIAGDLRLSYSQFEELETFARFSTRLDEETRKTLTRGRRVREILKQSQYSPIEVPAQILVLLAVTEGILDSIPLEEVSKAEKLIRENVPDRLGEKADKILSGEELNDEDISEMIDAIRKVLKREFEDAIA